MADQPLSLQWLCFLRDHGHDLKVTVGERALASLLPTYGAGQTIFVSMHTLSKLTGMSRNTVKKARDGLVLKGLLEDITGDPDKALRTYRLIVPGYISHGGSEFDPGVGQNLTQVGQNLTQGGSEFDPNIKQLNQEGDQATHQHHGLNDDASAKNLSGETQDHQSQWLGDGGNAPDNRRWLAENLGVPLGSIGASLWRFLEDIDREADARIYAVCECVCEAKSSGQCTHSDDCDCPCPVSGNAQECHCQCEHDRAYRANQDAVVAAIGKASGARNPVGYFQAILPGIIARHAA
jgi:hypothetical protein